MSTLTQIVRKALEGFNYSSLDKTEIEYFADNAPTWLAQLCDRVEELELFSKVLIEEADPHGLEEYFVTVRVCDFNSLDKALRGSDEGCKSNKPL